MFPRGAVTKCHKFGGLKWLKTALVAEIKVSAGLIPSGSSDRDPVPCFLLASDDFWESWAFLGLQINHSPSLLHLRMAFLSTSLNLFPLLFSYKDV